jgi:hypothetical protein
MRFLKWLTRCFTDLPSREVKRRANIKLPASKFDELGKSGGAKDDTHNVRIIIKRINLNAQIYTAIVCPINITDKVASLIGNHILVKNKLVRKSFKQRLDLFKSIIKSILRPLLIVSMPYIIDHVTALKDMKDDPCILVNMDIMSIPCTLVIYSRDSLQQLASPAWYAIAKDYYGVSHCIGSTHTWNDMCTFLIAETTSHTCKYCFIEYPAYHMVTQHRTTFDGSHTKIYGSSCIDKVGKFVSTSFTSMRLNQNNDSGIANTYFRRFTLTNM